MITTTSRPMRRMTETPADTRSDTRWRPLVVTAQMMEPVVTTGTGLHLDGVLSWGAFVLYSRDSGNPPLPPMSSTQVEDFTLPLATWRFGSSWGWCASAAQWPTHTIHRTEYVRRKPPEAEYKRLGRFGAYDYGVGPAKAVNKPIPTSFARTLTWYALGDADGVRACLEEVRAIGKLMAHGHGTVMSWTVEESAEDWSIERNGQLMRRMPGGWGGRASTHMGMIRAPYHHRTRLCAAVGPDDAA